MRRLLIAFTMLALLSSGAGEAASRRAEFSEADRAALDGISHYLNAITTLKGSFVQIGPNGDIDQGSFYISKPGRMRFVYDQPSPVLIVVDGRNVAVANNRLKTVDRYPLSQTPLGLVLGNDIDLSKDREVVGVVHERGSIVINVRTRGVFTRTNITLVFSEPEYELRQWSVLDNQGLTTTVALRDVTPGVDLASSLFQLPDRKSFARHSQD